MKLFNFPMFLFVIITFRQSEVLQSLTDMSLDRDSGAETRLRLQCQQSPQGQGARQVLPARAAGRDVPSVISSLKGRSGVN